ncbi:MAG TPA: threo-3-hydroxy-L-aspartate ammonia-lyase [Candidatus Eisenbacteria bacterium]|nr:threo-3-hydroxy-L-aspartate ammonia-lyase [Candidatus Eisenbacteria bacterium]
MNIEATRIPTQDQMIARLIAARQRLESVAHRTLVVTSRTLDERTGARVHLKCENLQRMGAFKFRGAYNTIVQIPEAERARGVVAYSSGNHGQAVTLVARMLGIPAAIVMPSTAPASKLDATRGYGAEVVFYDQAGEERDAMAERIARQRRMTLIPPFDHPEVIAGQGSATLELIEEAGPLDLLLVPVGGGGLISGAATAAQVLSPACRVIGVEPEAGDDGGRSFRSGALERVPVPDTIADGARTPSLSALTLAIIRRSVADMITASDAELIRAMRFVWERMKLIVEPTGVLGLAPLLAGRVEARGQRVGVILSGGNVDMLQARAWFESTPAESGVATSGATSPRPS